MLNTVVRPGQVWLVETGEDRHQIGLIRKERDQFWLDFQPMSPLGGIHGGPYESITDAMTAIARHAGGSCTMADSA